MWLSCNLGAKPCPDTRHRRCVGARRHKTVISGSGTVRHDHGRMVIESGDCFLFKPDQAHQLVNDSDSDLVILVVADNPIGESYHYPEEAMWIVDSPESRYVVQHPERTEPRR